MSTLIYHRIMFFVNTYRRGNCTCTHTYRHTHCMNHTNTHAVTPPPPTPYICMHTIIHTNPLPNHTKCDHAHKHTCTRARSVA